MWKDPIVEEVRKARAAYSKKHGNDVRRIAADLREREQSRTKSKSKTQVKGSKKKRAA